MTHSRLLQDRKRGILKTFVTPSLVGAGFKQKGNIYTRHVGRIQHIVEVEPSRLNAPGESSFALGCGVYLPGLWSGFTGLPEPDEPHVVDCTIRATPGLLTTPKREQWWRLKLSDTPERDTEIAQDVGSVVSEVVLPFLARFQESRDAAEFLSQPREKTYQQVSPYVPSMCFIYAGIIWDQLGEYDKCKDCMARAVELATGKRLEVKNLEFAREYVCGKLPRIA